MTSIDDRPTFGCDDLQLPDDLRRQLHAHLEQLRQRFLERRWGLRSGFGNRPALIVVDLALFWTQSNQIIGTNVDSVVEATCEVLQSARAAEIPIFFTSLAFDPEDLPGGEQNKMQLNLKPEDAPLFELDPRLQRRASEKLLRKNYASAFKATNLNELLTSRGIDTLIVTGVSTSHCIYATCRDAKDSFRVVVPREAVGERCELLHEVNLFDIDVDLGDVMPVSEVVGQLQTLQRD